MTKKDLKTGMVVKTRNGNTYTILLNAHSSISSDDILANHNGGFNRLSYYTDDLIHPGDNEFDIMEVFEHFGLGGLLPSDMTLEKVWEREHVPTVGDVYDAGHAKFVVTYKGISKYIAIMWADGSCGERTLDDFKSLGYKFTGKNVTKFVDILTNEVKDC